MGWRYRSTLPLSVTVRVNTTSPAAVPAVGVNIAVSVVCAGQRAGNAGRGCGLCPCVCSDSAIGVSAACAVQCGWRTANQDCGNAAGIGHWCNVRWWRKLSRQQWPAISDSLPLASVITDVSFVLTSVACQSSNGVTTHSFRDCSRKTNSLGPWCCNCTRHW